MLFPDIPALILAPMDGLTDAPMRDVQGQIGAFSFAVSEFVRVSASVPGKSAFTRSIPELACNARTPSGLPVQVQILGGDAARMAQSAVVACQAGASAIDINFGCPAPTVNNHDGGASLLKSPPRIREIVRAVRDAVPSSIPVSAKLRLGWDTIDAIYENAQMAAEGGANWIIIHGRTRQQNYAPPVHWEPIGRVREQIGVPVVANGDIWNLADFRRCRDTTGCNHFMLGRGGIGNPFLSHQIAAELGIAGRPVPAAVGTIPIDWRPYLRCLAAASQRLSVASPAQAERYLVRRMKQWLKIAALSGTFAEFDSIKRAETVDELFALLPPVSPRK